MRAILARGAPARKGSAHARARACLTRARTRWRIAAPCQPSTPPPPSPPATRAADLLLGIPFLLFLNSLPGFYTSKLYPYSNTWWSLVTEVQFYLLLPLLPLSLRPGTGRRTGAVLLLAYATTYGAFLLRL